MYLSSVSSRLNKVDTIPPSRAPTQSEHPPVQFVLIYFRKCYISSNIKRFLKHLALELIRELVHVPVLGYESTGQVIMVSYFNMNLFLKSLQCLHLRQSHLHNRLQNHQHKLPMQQLRLLGFD